MALFPRSWLTTQCLEAAEGRPPKGSGIPVFRSAFIERWIARAHPALPVLWGIPASVASIAYYLNHGGTGWRALGLVAAGWAIFSLVEYMLHRFLFHRKFPDTESGRLDAFLTHGYHHDYPSDRMRLVMPVMIAWPLAVGFFALYAVPFGVATASALFAGTALGYIAYDEVHYYTHHARPTTRLGRWMKQYHLLHHHDAEMARYGVSSPIWDAVFGTYRPLSKRTRNRREVPLTESNA